MSGRILLIDDEESFREDLARILREEGFACETAASGEDGLRAAEQEAPDLVLCDIAMPGMNGVEVTSRIAARLPESPVILITAYGTLDTAIEAFRSGASDYLLKPVVPEDLLVRIRRALQFRRMLSELRYLRRELSDTHFGTQLIGAHPAIQAIRLTIEKVAPTDSTVLITGESGTGKEVVARALHEAGSGPDRPFIAVNCAAVPRELVESELFGHVRGAFTGAIKDKPGLFELANGGTLFLDEIGELPLELQPKLLRAVEQGQLRRVGGTMSMPFHARLVAATSRDLKAEVTAGRFRADLYYRIRVVDIQLPPLRERCSDIPLLVSHILPRLNARLKRRVVSVDQPVMKLLTSAPWPGNIRELENVLERALILADGEYIGVQDLPPDLTAPQCHPEGSEDLRAAVRAFELQHIRQVLSATGGNREQAAIRLGVNPSTLYRRLKDLESE
ncbi:MAG: sigma-54-dependent transcriptional regulator [Candidatus Binatia bacterium]